MPKETTTKKQGKQEEEEEEEEDKKKLTSFSDKVSTFCPRRHCLAYF